MRSFTYNAIESTAFGILIDEGEDFKTAERDYTVCEIPGRNGDLTIDNGRYKNVDITYKCGIGVGFKANMDAFREWLMANIDYKRLEDSRQPTVYRMARVKSAPDPSVFHGMHGGTFEVTFDCKPQRFLKTGETMQSFTSSGTITNPSRYTALPLIRVYGTGTLTVGGATVTISSANSYTDLDCSLQDAFKGTTNCNGNIVLNSGSFPSLSPGSNGIVLGSGITRVEITPRWWTI